MIKGAVMDQSGKYRYSLWRIWNKNKPRATFIMLNPSTADDKIDDPTIRRCIGFAKSWGCGSIQVVNLFAFRATNPKSLRTTINPVGPENDKYIIDALKESDFIIAAWGTKGSLFNRDKELIRILGNKYKLKCLAITKYGYPKHPLYAKSDIAPVNFKIYQG
ncbi:hypothetical protein B5S50_08370 [Clostridium sp. 001]|nr:hypothetical protein B5S50_08370 [Clostridium sp. 001]